MAAITKNARVCEICGSPIETTSAGDLGCIACLIATGLDAETEQSHTASASAPDQLGAYTIEHHEDGSDDAGGLLHRPMSQTPPTTSAAAEDAYNRPFMLRGWRLPK